MSTRSRNRSRLIQAGAVCGPLAALGVAHVLFAPLPPPPDATGGASLVPASLAGAAERPMTPEQTRAAEWAHSLPADGALESPMDHPTIVVAAPPQREPEPTPDPVIPEPAPAAPTLDGLRLSVVIGNEQGGMALINGRVYRPGDSVRGMTIRSIDAKENTVHLAAADGAVLVLKRAQ